MASSTPNAQDFFRSLFRLRQSWIRFFGEPKLREAFFGLVLLIRHNCESKPEQPGVTVSELARQLNQSNAAVSQKITILEQKGLVERTVSPEDRRVYYIRLTPQGHQSLSQAQQWLRDQLSGVLEQMGPEKSTQLLQLLEELANLFQTLPPAASSCTSNQGGNKH